MPGGEETNPIILNAVTDFPDPLSPIIPKQAPFFAYILTPSTAL